MRRRSTTRKFGEGRKSRPEILEKEFRYTETALGKEAAQLVLNLPQSEKDEAIDRRVREAPIWSTEDRQTLQTLAAKAGAEASEIVVRLMQNLDWISKQGRVSEVCPCKARLQLGPLSLGRVETLLCRVPGRFEIYCEPSEQSSTSQ